MNPCKAIADKNHIKRSPIHEKPISLKPLTYKGVWISLFILPSYSLLLARSPIYSYQIMSLIDKRFKSMSVAVELHCFDILIN
jgi:hypothetical protein